MFVNVITFYRSKDNFTFKCHRSVVTAAGQTQNIYAVREREGVREGTIMVCVLYR